MKLYPTEYSFTMCWCGCDVKYHLEYVEYTGYACTNCTKCNDFAKHVNG